ncbi:MAG: carboxymuconolactone decarboxylase family protein [Pseudolabrys sp.]
MPTKRPTPRLPLLNDEQLTPPQRALMEAIRSGPRGKAMNPRGPFAAFIHAPAFGDLAQQLGAHCRYHTALEPRLSEFAILCTARQWRAQYEWYAHAPMAEKAGVSPKTIAELRAGRAPKSAKKDERAIYDFVQELYKTRRVSDRAYKRVRSFLNDGALVELIGILGYYVMISMTLNVFRMLPPDDVKLAFAEPK